MSREAVVIGCAGGGCRNGGSRDGRKSRIRRRRTESGGRRRESGRRRGREGMRGGRSGGRRGKVSEGAFPRRAPAVLLRRLPVNRKRPTAKPPRRPRGAPHRQPPTRLLLHRCTVRRDRQRRVNLMLEPKPDHVAPLLTVTPRLSETAHNRRQRCRPALPPTAAVSTPRCVRSPHCLVQLF